MNEYAIFAYGSFWGIWPARNKKEAIHDAAYDEGFGDDLTGIVAHLMTEAEDKALMQWVEDGFPEGKFPIPRPDTEEKV